MVGLVPKKRSLGGVLGSLPSSAKKTPCDPISHGVFVNGHDPHRVKTWALTWQGWRRGNNFAQYDYLAVVGDFDFIADLGSAYMAARHIGADISEIMIWPGGNVPGCINVEIYVLAKKTISAFQQDYLIHKFWDDILDEVGATLPPWHELAAIRETVRSKRK